MIPVCIEINGVIKNSKLESIKCGDIFCDTCGDCIHCFGEVSCFDPSTGDEYPWHHPILYPEDELYDEALKNYQADSEKSKSA